MQLTLFLAIRWSNVLHVVGKGPSGGVLTDLFQWFQACFSGLNQWWLSNKYGFETTETIETTETNKPMGNTLDNTQPQEHSPLFGQNLLICNWAVVSHFNTKQPSPFSCTLSWPTIQPCLQSWLSGIMRNMLLWMIRFLLAKVEGFPWEWLHPLWGHSCPPLGDGKLGTGEVIQREKWRGDPILLLDGKLAISARKWQGRKLDCHTVNVTDQ